MIDETNQFIADVMARHGFCVIDPDDEYPVYVSTAEQAAATREVRRRAEAMKQSNTDF